MSLSEKQMLWTLAAIPQNAHRGCTQEGSVCNTPASAALALPSQEAHRMMTSLGTYPRFYFTGLRRVWAQGIENKGVPLHSTREDSGWFFPTKQPLKILGLDHRDKGLKTKTKTTATIYYRLIKWNKQIWSISFIFQFLFWTEWTSFEFFQITCWNNDLK